MIKRESGYYWVRQNGKDYIAWYSAIIQKLFLCYKKEHWILGGEKFQDRDFEEIDERKIIRS